VDAGKALLWQVDALLPDGKTVSSPTFTVRVLAFGRRPLVETV
jgi:hypothetical protein